MVQKMGIKERKTLYTRKYISLEHLGPAVPPSTSLLFDLIASKRVFRCMAKL